jgi:hypothetical protein
MGQDLKLLQLLKITAEASEPTVAIGSLAPTRLSPPAE